MEELQIEEADDDTPVINLLNTLIERAVNTNASDIHIEPFEHKTTVRMRLDGTITEYVTLQKQLHASLIARIKILSDLDIAERRAPQDGHFRTQVKDEMINIRVSVIPTVFGEKAVLRLLTGNAAIDHPASFGMKDSDYQNSAGFCVHPTDYLSDRPYGKRKVHDFVYDTGGDVGKAGEYLHN